MISSVTALTLSTVRLACKSGKKTSLGTGFLYHFAVSPKGQKSFLVPMIVTNKHVVKGMDTLETVVTLIPRGKELTDRVSDHTDIHVTLEQGNLQRAVVNHPDAAVDVCAVSIHSLLSQVPSHMELRHMFLDRSWHLTPEEQSFTRPVEPIVMVGYPTGLWNEETNHPLVRHGLTASHPLVPWNGQRQFVIDAACFPGSSGSPVFLYEDGVYREQATTYKPGSRAKLLGLLFAGPQFTNEGRLEQRTIPTSLDEIVPVIKGMMNLGFVAPADTLDELIPVIERQIEGELAQAGSGAWLA